MGMLIDQSATVSPDPKLACVKKGIHPALSWFILAGRGEERGKEWGKAIKVKGKKKEREKRKGGGRTALRECGM